MGGSRVSYFLDESTNWGLDVTLLRKLDNLVEGGKSANKGLISADRGTKATLMLLKATILYCQIILLSFQIQVKELERSLAEAKRNKIRVRALVVINPGAHL